VYSENNVLGTAVYSENNVLGTAVYSRTLHSAAGGGSFFLRYSTRT
jgi:hypothetical protein